MSIIPAPALSTEHVTIPALASVNFAATLLGVHPQTVYRMIYRGDLTATRLGKRAVRIHGDSLAKLAGI